MVKIRIDWNNPIFGDVPNKYRSWYLKHSGTNYSKEQGWFVDRDEKMKDPKNGAKEVLKAAIFQDGIVSTKKTIQSQMGTKGAYFITNENIFDLMKGGSTTIEYEYQGQKFIQKISV